MRDPSEVRGVAFEQTCDRCNQERTGGTTSDVKSCQKSGVCIIMMSAERRDRGVRKPGIFNSDGYSGPTGRRMLDAVSQPYEKNIATS